MNPHVSKNGKYLTFMGINPSDNRWSVYLYNLINQSAPTNLTENRYWRAEDPKFSNDSSKIIFKCNLKLCLYELGTQTYSTIYDSPIESSMPYFHPEGNKIVFSSGAGSDADIKVYNHSTNVVQTLYNEANLQEYYPYGLGKRSFYFVRWFSNTQKFDQIYLGFYGGKTAKKLAFNTTEANYSDPCALPKGLLFFSATIRDNDSSTAGYDLYLANRRYKEVFKIPNSTNSSFHELGCSYTKTNYN